MLAEYEWQNSSQTAVIVFALGFCRTPSLIVALAYELILRKDAHEHGKGSQTEHAANVDQAVVRGDGFAIKPVRLQKQDQQRADASV